MTAVDTEPLAWDPLNEKYKADPTPSGSAFATSSPSITTRSSTSTQ